MSENELTNKEFKNWVLGIGIFFIIIILIFSSLVVYVDFKNKKELKEKGLDGYLYSKGFGLYNKEITSLEDNLIDSESIKQYYYRKGYKLINIKIETNYSSDVTYGYGYNIGRGFGLGVRLEDTVNYKIFYIFEK